MNAEELREENVEEAKQIFDDMAAIVPNVSVSWVWKKERSDRTICVIALLSFLRLARSEYVFFNPKYLEEAINIWKKLAETDPSDQIIRKAIAKYEERLKQKKNIGGIGEHIVDLSSSYCALPISLTMALEYEPSPDWGEIMYDFRKLLIVLAPLKVGIFHLPSYPTTSRVWVQDENTGNLEWESKVVDATKLDELIEGMKSNVRLNEMEHSYSIYLMIFIQADEASKTVTLKGYLLWREVGGEVHLEMLETRKLAI
jgi:tetratricopeptide (TPR) repeat protein